MALVQQIAVFAHLIGFAALLGGSLAQFRSGPPPEINVAMLYGAWISLLTGVGLVVLVLVRQQSVHWVEYAIKLVLTALIVLLVVKNRKFQSVPGGLLLIIVAATLINAGLAVLWPGGG